MQPLLRSRSKSPPQSRYPEAPMLPAIAPQLDPWFLLCFVVGTQIHCHLIVRASKPSQISVSFLLRRVSSQSELHLSSNHFHNNGGCQRDASKPSNPHLCISQPIAHLLLPPLRVLNQLLPPGIQRGDEQTHHHRTQHRLDLPQWHPHGMIQGLHCALACDALPQQHSLQCQT